MIVRYPERHPGLFYKIFTIRNIQKEEKRSGTSASTYDLKVNIESVYGTFKVRGSL